MSGGEIESLIATRKRRSNAGSRLKQLLKAEEIANEGDEDDNDIDLLFQEDDDDAEFQVGDKDRYGYQGSDEDEGESDEDGEQGQGEEVEGSDKESQREGTTSLKEDVSGESGNEDEEVVDNDDVFSDSEDEDSDDDDSDEGEKELQKQERAKKRQAQKKARQIPKIITKPKVAAPKKKTQPHGPKADTLLSLSRRQSSRKTAVQNKMDLVSRLKENEIRRQSIKPVAKVEYIEMTQEERLAEAIETEKYNVSTLNKYKEQEIDKKKKQRALQLSKRKRLENVVSYKSCPIFVTPVEEHELEQFLLTRDTLRRKRDRRGRKSEKQKREEEEARKKEEARKQRAAMFIIQPKSSAHNSETLKKLKDEGVDIKPLIDAESATETKVEAESLELTNSNAPSDLSEATGEPEIRKEEEEPKEVKMEKVPKESIEDNEEKQESNNDKQDMEDGEQDPKKRPLSADSITKEENDLKRRKTDDPESDSDIELVKPKVDEKATIEEDNNKDEGDNEVTHGETDTAVVREEISETREVDADDDEKDAKTTEVPDAPNVDESKVEHDSEAVEEIKDEEEKPEKEEENEKENEREKEEKNANESEVKVSDDKMDIDTPDPTIKTEDAEDKPIKTVKFADEQEQNPSEKVGESNLSRETSLEPSSREESSMIEDAIVFEGPPQKVAANFISFEESTKRYTVDEIKAYLFGPQSLLPALRKSHEVEPVLRLRADAISEDDKVDDSLDLPDFEFLNNFPKFGEFNKVKKEQVVLETREDIKVVLKTQPPIGIHLPNGTKKQCLITGKPAMYFDPRTGLPYGSVEAYKVIKDIQNGSWAWTDFPGGGSYVCNRDNTVHAKGVPDGFDE